MDTLWQSEITINLFLQSIGIWLTPIMRLFSFFGQEEFYMMTLPLIYWCIDSQLAVRFLFLLILSSYSNSILKVTFHGARPYWFDPGVSALSSETTFGLPSGHAQNAASVWGLMANTSNNRWGKFLFFLLAFIIGVSRLYLGVHFASDVICGWLLGALILILLLKFEKPFMSWFNPLTLPYKLLLIFTVSLFFLFFGVWWSIIQSQIPIPIKWIQNVVTVPDASPINPYSIDHIVSLSGIFLGMAGGSVWLFNKTSFNGAKGTNTQKIGRFFFGILGVLILAYGLGAIFPHTSDVLGTCLRFLRYAISGLWITALAPLIFKKISLS